MENFLSNFANTNTEVTSSNANISVSPEFFGTIDINKCGLKMKIHFYARVYKTKYENCISLDDWDINETSDISFCNVWDRLIPPHIAIQCTEVSSPITNSIP